MPRAKAPTPEERAAMAEQTANEKKQQLEAEGTYVSPTREPEMPEIDLIAEAERIFDEPATDEEIEGLWGKTLEEEAREVARSMGLHAKLAKIRANFGFIGKTGTNTGVGGGYKFVEATEVSRRFVQMASDLNLTMIPILMQVTDIRPSVSGKQFVYTVQSAWKITDADSGETDIVYSFGQGADNGDKALPKAQTNAMKYAILLLLQAAGDDPENDPNTDRLENTPTGPAVTIGSSNVPGVQAGGRQGQVTEAQLDAFRRLVVQHKLETAEICILIDQSIGKLPVLPEGGTSAEQAAILKFLGELTFAEAGSIIKGLMALPTPEES